jgi:hypothetical protein
LKCLWKSGKRSVAIEIGFWQLETQETRESEKFTQTMYGPALQPGCMAH